MTIPRDVPPGDFTGADHGAGVSVRIATGDEPWHAHPVEEVAAIVDGTATYFLGAQQARIVRAGQVARVPAGVEHRVVAHDAFRAVLAYGATEIVTTPRA